MHPNDGRVVSNFIVAALKGDPITVYGEGSQTRSFCYVDDLVDGLVRLMHTGDDFTGPVNLGNPQECSILEIAQKILDISGSSSRIEYRPLPLDDPKQRRPAIELARERLGWQPHVALEDGLRKTIAYFDALLSRGAPVPSA